MLEGLLKGLVLWIYQLIIEGVENLSGALIEVFNMDLAYFEAQAPVTASIIQIMMAAGWALLIGNLAFQAMRAMASGLGFEGEDPKILFARTFVFSFLLMVSRQICDTGLTVTGRVIDLVGIPSSVTINLPKDSHFGFFDSTWLVVVVIGLILIFQIIRFFFEIAERYVILATLTIMAPLAFGMGGSKNTEDIFKGWARMYGSMCVMMLMNVVFLKLLLSAMSTIPSGAGVLPWLLFVVAIARVARKVDDLVCRIGLNPARTGDPLGRGLPLMVTMAVARSMGRTVAATMSNHSNTKEGKGGAPGKAGQSPRPGSPQKSGGSFGQKPSRQGRGPAQAGTTAETPVSKPSVGQSPPPGQQQSSAESLPSKRKNGRQQRGEPPIPRGKQGGQKPPAAPPGTPTPPPARPPIKRKNPGDIPPKEQEQQGHSAQSAGGSLPLQQGTAGTIQGCIPKEKEGQTSTPTRPPLQKGEKSSQERPKSRPSRKNNNPPGSGETPPALRKNTPAPPVAPGAGETPPVPRKNNPPAQHPVTPGSGGDTPPASRSKKQSQQKAASGSGEAPPASRRNTPPAQRPVAPGSGEAPPASHRNSNPPQIIVPAAEPPQSSDRKVIPKPSVPGNPLQGGINGKAAPPPPTKETPQPTPRRKADPKGETPQKPKHPSRPPLNQKRGGEP